MGRRRVAGWWGDDPPYHHAVFVFTHRDPIEVTGSPG
jgi:hypothetical protein